MRNKQHADYQVVPYPKLRRLLAVMLHALQRKPMMHFLIEVDVTRARQSIRDHKANTGEALWFTAFLIACLGKAVDEHKAAQAYRKGRKHLVLFDEVDVETQIERETAGHKQNITYIIRAANRKTFREIHHEIRAAQVEDVAKARVGGIGVKPGVVDGSIAIREYLSLTISLDHNLIDGAPAVRFTSRLKN